MDLSRKNGNRLLFGYLLVAPALILTVLFVFVPLVEGIRSSLEVGFGQHVRFVGLKHYIATFMGPRFWNSLRVSVIFTAFFIAFSAGLGLLIALSFKNNRRGQIFYMSAFFIPYISTPVIGALVWRNMLDDPYGISNLALTSLGLPAIPWFLNPTLALIILIFIQIWYTVGYNAILFLAGLQAIPPSYFEAADLEGCTFFKRLRYITLPLLLPTTVFVITISIMYGFINSYVLASLVTDNGPFEATNVMMSYILDYAFNRENLNRANAVTLIMFVVFLAIALVQFNYQRKRFVGLD